MRDEATMNANFSATGQRKPGFLGKLLAFVFSAALFVLAFMFSLVALAVVAVGASLFAAWFWWKTRALRKRMPTMNARRYQDGNVIEGEAIRTSDTSSSGKLLP